MFDWLIYLGRGWEWVQSVGKVTTVMWRWWHCRDTDEKDHKAFPKYQSTGYYRTCINVYIYILYLYTVMHISKYFFVWLTLLYSNKLTIWRTESYWQYIALLFYCDSAILHVNIHGLCIPTHKNTFPNCVNGSPRVCQSVFLKNEPPRSEMVTNRWSGWWFGTWILFSTIVGMMIQSD